MAAKPIPYRAGDVVSVKKSWNRVPDRTGWTGTIQWVGKSPYSAGAFNVKWDVPHDDYITSWFLAANFLEYFERADGPW